MTTTEINWTTLGAMIVCWWLYSQWLLITEGKHFALRQPAHETLSKAQCLSESMEQSLPALLSYDIAQYRRVGRKIRFVAAFGLGLPLILWMIACSLHASEMMRVSLLAVTLAPVRLLTAHQRERSRCCRGIEDTTGWIHQRRMTEGIAPLMEAMEVTQDSTAYRVRRVVIDILPLLKSHESSLIGAKHRTRLHRALHSSDAELLLATLSALEQIGDSKAIPHVRRLTQCPEWIIGSDRISAAARRCLQRLLVRKKAKQDACILLRSVLVPAVSEILLRPTARTEQQEPNELLRAVKKPPQPVDFQCLAAELMIYRGGRRF